MHIELAWKYKVKRLLFEAVVFILELIQPIKRIFIK